MNTVEKVEKVSKLSQPGTEWLYGYTKSCNKVPVVAVGASDTGTAGEWAKHQGFLSDGRDKQKCILLLAEEIREVTCTELAKTEEPKNIVPSGWMQLTPKQAQHAKEAMVIEINSCHVMVNAQTYLELLKKICLTLRSLK